MEIVYRVATKSDIRTVFGWLIETKQKNDTFDLGVSEVDGFFRNWKFIRGDYHAGLVEVAVIDNVPVAFCTGTANQIEILEVKPSFRGRGIGKAFARHRLDRAYKAGVKALSLECAPASSLPFWESIGFVEIVSPRGTFAQIKL